MEALNDSITRRFQPALAIPAGPLAKAGTRLCRVSDGSALYEQACRLSAQQYKRHFSCDLSEFYPNYFCLVRRRHLLAICGYRSAAQALFLEQYLDHPVEALLSPLGTQTVSRDAIIEVGGFALRSSKVALAFMADLAPAFWALGYTHAVCTATLPVRRCLRTLGVPTITLGKAERSRLDASTTNWGNYYAMRPVVIGGSIANAVLSVLPPEEKTVSL